MTQNLGNRVQAHKLASPVRFRGDSSTYRERLWPSVTCQNAGKPLVRWPSREDTSRSVALADHGAPLTVITLSHRGLCGRPKPRGLAKWKAREVQPRSLRQSGCRVQLRPSDYRGSRGDAFASPRLSRLNIAARYVSLFGRLTGERRRVELTVTIWPFCVCLPRNLA